MKKKDDEIPVERVWQQHQGYKQNDLNQPIYQLAVFSTQKNPQDNDKPDNKFYKLAGVDFRAKRLDVSGEKVTRWLTMNDENICFVFTNENEFEKYYNIYMSSHTHCKSKQDIFDWLAGDMNRIVLRKY